MKTIVSIVSDNSEQLYYIVFYFRKDPDICNKAQ